MKRRPTRAQRTDPNNAEPRRDGRHLAGVWRDLDWEELADELDRIRHDSAPTPPIDLDV